MKDLLRPENWERGLKKLLAPPLFLMGVVVGFGVCCVAGRMMPELLPFEGFHRFHSYIDPQTLYFPTALQIQALAKRELPTDKIAVIVGGSSVMQGVGQTVDELWTKRLQNLLGNEYRVLNLAMVGGAPNEHSQVAAEMINRDHARLIHVCDCRLHPFTAHPDGMREVYRYVFHDARTRNLLMPFPQRDAALEALEPTRNLEPAYPELRSQLSLNRWLSFNDFWHVVGYQYGFTVWSSVSRNQPWRARQHLRDKAVHVESPRAFSPKNLSTIRGYADKRVQTKQLSMETEVKQAVPPTLRPKTLAVINRWNPAHLHAAEKLTPGVQENLRRNIQGALAQLHAAGLDAVEGCVSLNEDDFVDRNHLRATGGAKLADELAPVIREKARRLGYLDAEPCVAE